MKTSLLCIALLICWAGLANAEKFDCVNLPFGKDLSEFDKEGHFIKYKEQDGISYYNYAGSLQKGRVHARPFWYTIHVSLKR